LLDFFIIHSSSLFGAIIFCFLIAYLKLKKTFMIVPLAIEILQSWLACRCFDYWDLIFSLIGILSVMIIETKEKNKLISNK
jgi:glycopeptide antibiotics resistance protein